MKKSFFPLLSVVVLLLLLTHPALSFQGASRGLLLWYQTVLPTLLPFMICSNMIVAVNGIPLLTAPVRPLLKGLLRLSDHGCYVLMTGLLCGYPMGAKTCSEFTWQGRISQREGAYLLSISNHPSPMFLLGYVSAVLDSSIPMFLVLTAIYLPVLPLAFLARSVYGIHGPCVSSLPQDRQHISFDQSMMNSFEVMIKIGGYIMLFTILAEFIGQIPFLSSSLQAVLLGLIEITTGIQAVSHVFTETAQGMILCFVTAFGGFCGFFQTRSVIKSPCLSASHYLLWKLLHASASAGTFILLASLLVPGH